MRAINFFKDSNNIIVRGFTPHYNYKGTSYKDKLMNGLALDYVFGLNSEYYNVCETVYNLIDGEKKYSKLNYDIEHLDDIKYNNIEINKNINRLKKNNVNKKINKVNKKTNKIKNKKTKSNKRRDGYNYKLFIVEQNTPEIFVKGEEYVHYCYYYGDEDNSIYTFSSYNIYDDYSYNYNFYDYIL